MTEDKYNKKLTFPQFDVVSDFSDHRFLCHNGSSLLKKAGKSCFKAISKEWRILQESLPESIFVRVSETRYDLLRAAIIGAAGTPYHDALFFFDIVVAPNYPKEPPKVYYHSHGHRINPNLYSTGAVCLSLLNTWIGSRSEHWNPKMSTLLQVLLSLQSLVLNEEPYFNEPGRRYYRNNKLSEYYSQDVFLLTCKTTINLIRNPPRNFEPLISHHFRERGNAILAACEAYKSGRLMVGLYGCDGACSASFEIRREFQTNMGMVYAQLVKEFRRVEASVQVTGERSIVVQKPSVTNLNKQEREGIFKKMIEKTKRCFGIEQEQ